MQYTFESLQPFFEEIILMIKDESFPYDSFVYREIFRFFSILITNLGSSELWLKFDSRKVLSDYGNNIKYNLIYKDQYLNWDIKPQSTDQESGNLYKDNKSSQDKFHFLPYKNITQYHDSMGIVFDGEYYIELSESINLPDNFTISFKFFNPVIHSKRHSLLMNEDGTLPVIAISPTKDQLGYYNKKGKFVDSKIPIYTNDFDEKWVTITIRRVKEKEDNLLTKKIAWFANGKYISSTIIKVNDKENDIVDNIKYIGNSKSFDEPFGAFCDLRIQYKALTNDEIMNQYCFEENDNSKVLSGEETIIQFLIGRANMNYLFNLTHQKFLNEEEILFAVRYMNKIMIKIESRRLFNNYNLIMLLTKYLSDEFSNEVREEISKFIITLS